MKKRILTTVAAVFILVQCFSQDVITLRSGESFVAKVLEIGVDSVRYKKFNDLEGLTYTVLKSDVVMIRYSNGTQDNFSQQAAVLPPAGSTGMAPYAQGRLDAKKYYKKYGGAMVGTLIPSICTPIGLIPAVLCAGATPRDNNLGYPNAELMKNEYYKQGYTQKATSMKQNRVWACYLGGTAVFVTAIAIFLSSSGGFGE